MNRFKRLCALLGVLAAVCAATFALTRYNERKETVKSTGEVILEIPSGSVTALSWEYADENDALSFRKEADTWRWDGDSAFPVSEEKVMNILSHFEALRATFRIEDVEDYGQYGLEDPECTIRLTAGEDSRSIRLGDFSQLDQQRYVDIGDGNVYLVSEDPMDYVDPALSTMIQNDDAPGFETVEEISFTGRESYAITRAEDSPDAYSSEDLYFTARDGKNVPLDSTAVGRYLNTVTSLDLLSYVTYNATEEELASYGLDAPELSASIRYLETDGEEQVEKTFTFHISADPQALAEAQAAEEKGEAAENVPKYVRIGDSQIVYQLDDVDYGILSAAAYDDLRHKEVLWSDSERVTGMEIALDGTRYTLSSAMDPEEETRLWYNGAVPEAEDGESDEQTEPQETLDMTDVLSALSGLYADSFTSEAPSGQQEIAVTVRLDDPNHPTVEIALYRYDGEHCLAVVDGQSVSLVPRASAVALMEAIHAIVL